MCIFFMFRLRGRGCASIAAEFGCAGKMLAECRWGFRLVNKFSRIYDSVWIECLFEPPMQFTRHVAGRLGPPAFFGHPDSVLAGNYAAPGQHLCEKIVERVLDFFAHNCVAIVTVCHDIDVNVSVPGVTETGDWKSILILQCLREFHEIDQTTAWHDHILV